MPARRRPPHGARFALHAGERSDAEHRLGLAVAFVDRLSGSFFPCPDHLGVKGFAGAAAVAQVGEIERVEVGQDQHPVDGRGAAERRDPVFLHQRQDFGGMEPAPDIVDKDARADDPLAEEFPPRALPPAGIGDRQVKVVRVQVVPQPPGDDVPEGVGVVVQHHLRLAGGPRGEEDQHRVRCSGPVHAGEVHQFVRAGCRVVELDGVTDPSVPNAVDHEPDRERGALFPDLLDLTRMFGHGDDHLDIGRLNAVLQVLWGQHRRCGTVHGAEFDEGDDEDPPLGCPGEHQHDPVALLDAVFQADVDRLI